jgi:hypothetical protein
MGHDQNVMLKDYWLTQAQFYAALYLETPFLLSLSPPSLWPLLSSPNQKDPDKTDDTCDQLWKIITIFDKPSDS